MKSGPKPRSANDRFDSMIFKREGGCWLWGGNEERSRYSSIIDDSGLAQAGHRFSYKRYKGDIPDTLIVRHKCDVMNCVNPDHLELGTHKQNMADKVERGRANGHGKATLKRRVRRYLGNKKLHRDEIERIRAEYATGDFSQSDLAHRWSVSQATISATIRGVHNCSSGLPPKQRSGHYRQKITESQRQEIRSKYSSGSFTQQVLAAEYGVTQARVSDIITGRDKKRSLPSSLELPA